MNNRLMQSDSRQAVVFDAATASDVWLIRVSLQSWFQAAA
jgi:hypothetical protein